jgi:formiminotetrahydrofolate cyclodeaminase
MPDSPGTTPLPPPASLDLASMPFGTLLDAIAAKTPTPGGGAVASAVGALGAALGSMILAYSVDRKSLSEHRPALVGAASGLAASRAALLQLAADDAAGYGELNALMKLPESDPARSARWAGAVERALTPPLKAARECAAMLDLLASLPRITNPHLKSDLAIAGVLAEAAARSAWWNVAVNLPLLQDVERRGAIEREGAGLLARAVVSRAELERACG